jgi:hypothetical protein
MEEAPGIRIIAKELLDQYKIYEGTKSKIRRSDEGKRLDKLFKKLEKVLNRDETIYQI